MFITEEQAYKNLELYALKDPLVVEIPGIGGIIKQAEIVLSGLFEYSGTKYYEDSIYAFPRYHTESKPSTPPDIPNVVQEATMYIVNLMVSHCDQDPFTRGNYESLTRMGRYWTQFKHGYSPHLQAVDVMLESVKESPGPQTFKVYIE